MIALLGRAEILETSGVGETIKWDLDTFNEKNKGHKFRGMRKEPAGKTSMRTPSDIENVAIKILQVPEL